MAKPHKKQKPADAAEVFAKIRSVVDELESKSYYDLRDKTRKLVASLKSLPQAPKVEAWSFVPHPDVVRALTGDDGMRRYIVTIDALRSRYYFHAEEFLAKQKINVTSFYTGGWADFLCDVYLTPARFEEFLRELKTVLKTAKIQALTSSVDDVLTYFEVTDSVVLCGHIVRERPVTPAAVDRIVIEREKFELALRDYTSGTLLAAFGGDENKRKTYVRKLYEQNAIICFRPILDYSFYSTRDYVPMILETDRAAPIDALLSEWKTDSILRIPVVDLLRVKCLHAAEKAEEEVNYMFVNRYDFPGQRKAWKLEMYRRLQVDSNLYSYPLEGTLNETATYVSDLPDVLAAAREYTPPGIDIGSVVHRALPSSDAVRLPVEGLARHGATFGGPGSGKTNADLVLVSAAVGVLETVAVVDGTGGFVSKLNVLPPAVLAKLNRVSLTSTDATASALLYLGSPGFYLFECSSTDYPSVLNGILDAMEQLTDAAVGGRARVVKSLLLVEEADTAFGREAGVRSQTSTHILQMLNKAYRKGWCVWLSTQFPSQLGRELVSSLHTRLVGKLMDSDERQLLAEILKADGLPSPTVDTVMEDAAKFPIGTFACHGHQMTPYEHPLPLLRISVPHLQ